MASTFCRDESVTIYNQDCADMSAIPDGVVDAVVTDPPYGISFMGKDWDKALPDIQIWRECLRVLKPGAFAFVMSIPRSDCLSRMIVSLEDAGFRVDFTPIYWAYASGFPKAQNIGKSVDKRNGRQDSFAPFAKHYGLRRKLLEYTHAFICEQGHFYDEHNHGGASVNWEQGHNVPTLDQWEILQPLLGLSLEYLPLIEREEAEREVVGQRDKARAEGQRSALPTLGAKTEYITIDDTTAATPQAQALDGSYGGFQPKPAVEVIIVAMKPLSGKTYVDQALKNGHGVTWLDDGRIPYGSEGDIQKARIGFKGDILPPEKGWNDNAVQRTSFDQSAGRFPANLLVSDDVLNDGRVQKSGTAVNRHRSGRPLSTVSYAPTSHIEPVDIGYPDSGSFSRYFDLDKWAQRTFPFLIVPKASKAEKNRGLGGLPDTGSRRYGDRNQGPLPKQTPQAVIVSKNPHPTVKPLKLMSYLITLGSRPEDVVLDPFLGSGTTALAAKLLGRKCIGYEIDEAYCETARNRCSQGVML